MSIPVNDLPSTLPDPFATATASPSLPDFQDQQVLAFTCGGFPPKLNSDPNAPGPGAGRYHIRPVKEPQVDLPAILQLARQMICQDQTVYPCMVLVEVAPEELRPLILDDSKLPGMIMSWSLGMWISRSSPNFLNIPERAFA